MVLHRHAGSGSAFGDLLVKVNGKLIKNFVRNPQGFHRIPPRYLFVLNPDRRVVSSPCTHDKQPTTRFQLRDFPSSATLVDDLSSDLVREPSVGPGTVQQAPRRPAVPRWRYVASHSVRRVASSPRAAPGSSARAPTADRVARRSLGFARGVDRRAQTTGTSAATTGRTPPAPTPPSRRSNRRCGTFRTTRPRPRPTRGRRRRRRLARTAIGRATERTTPRGGRSSSRTSSARATPRAPTAATPTPTRPNANDGASSAAVPPPGVGGTSPRICS